MPARPERVSGLLRPSIAILLLEFSSVIYAGGPACAPPKQQAVCDAHVVSKEKLANYILDTCGVSRNFQESQSAVGHLSLPPAEEDRLRVQGIALTPAERLLVTDPCAASSCSKDDTQALAAAQGLLNSMLNFEAPAYRNVTGAFTATDFLEDKNASLACGVDGQGKPIEAAGAVPDQKPDFGNRLRIRGSTDGLFFMNSAAQFASVDKANLGSTYGSGNTTRTDKILAVVGFAVLDPRKLPLYNAIPYVGVNRNLSRPTNKSVSVNSDTMQFGLLNSFEIRTVAQTPLTHWITLRPDFLVNHKDGSHLATASVDYTPIVNCPVCLNDYRKFGPVWVEPIIDARSDFGHYARRGDTANADYRNYWRVGPRAGVSVTSENAYVPLQLTLTDTFLEGLTGTLPHVNYFKAVLSYKIVGKFISLDLGFSNGRREDTAQPEHQWSVAFAGAF
jgi:hypothetical protein